MHFLVKIHSVFLSEMITIAELFPLYSGGTKWMSVFREPSECEIVRLEKEFTIYYRKPLSEKYTIDGKWHRRNDCAVIQYRTNGSMLSMWWMIHGDYYREGDKPQYVRYFLNGNVSCEKWYQHDKYHRIDGPALVEYHNNGQVKSEQWYVNGVRHRQNDPAVIKRNSRGEVQSLKWYTHGVIHRKKGPAHRHFDS